MTDILNLPGWKAIATRQEGAEYVIEADYTIQPKACQKCGVIDRLYRHGAKATTYRDSPIFICCKTENFARGGINR